MKMKSLLVGLILVVFAMTAWAQGSNTLPVGSLVKDFSLQDTKDQTYKLSAVLQKEQVKAVLLTVYSSGCGFCVSDMPKMEEAYKALKEQGLRWMGVSVDASQDTAKNFAQTHKLSLINLYDGKREVAKSLKYARTPHSVLVSKERKVVRVYPGTSPQLLAQMRSDLVEYLSSGQVTSAPPAAGGG